MIVHRMRSPVRTNALKSGMAAVDNPEVATMWDRLRRRAVPHRRARIPDLCSEALAMIALVFVSLFCVVPLALLAASLARATRTRR
jgi:hypothetical protein